MLIFRHNAIVHFETNYGILKSEFNRFDSSLC